MIAIDTHTHTTASGHAYSSLEEMARAASEKGLPGFVMTDHSPGMPGGPHIFHFYNARVIPRIIHNTMVFKGIEANIINFEGEIDVEKELLQQMEVVIASFHIPVCPPGSVEENTHAYMNAVKNPYIKIIGHPDDGRFPYDIPSLARAAADSGTILEINNSSMKPGAYRTGAEGTYRELLKECRKEGVKITLSSDAHFSAHMGDVSNCTRLVKDMNYPEELIINRSLESFLKEMNLSL